MRRERFTEVLNIVKTREREEMKDSCPRLKKIEDSAKEIWSCKIEGLQESQPPSAKCKGQINRMDEGGAEGLKAGSPRENENKGPSISQTNGLTFSNSIPQKECPTGRVKDLCSFFESEGQEDRSPSSFGNRNPSKPQVKMQKNARNSSLSGIRKQLYPDGVSTEKESSAIIFTKSIISAENPNPLEETAHQQIKSTKNAFDIASQTDLKMQKKKNSEKSVLNSLKEIKPLMPETQESLSVSTGLGLGKANRSIRVIIIKDSKCGSTTELNQSSKLYMM